MDRDKNLVYVILCTEIETRICEVPGVYKTEKEAYNYIKNKIQFNTKKYTQDYYFRVLEMVVD